MTTKVNPVLMKMAQSQVWKDATEKQAFQPPGGMDPAMMGGGGMPPPGGAPPMDPAMAGGMPPPGGAPPMDPAMAGGMPPPPGGAPPMDPMAGAMPAPPMDPMAAAGGAQQKMKPEQMMQMLDFRMYNMQQQMTALLNHLQIEIPPGALVMPPGQVSPTPEAALPGGSQDPTMQAGGGGGGGSAISPIEPMQGAAPELAGGPGGGGAPAPKAASHVISDAAQLPGSFMRKAELSNFMKEANEQAPVGYRVALVKLGDGEKADISSTEGDVDEQGPQVSAPDQGLNVPGSPSTTPSLRPHPNNTAGGSVDPESVTDGPMPAAKSAAQRFAASLAGEPQRPASYVGTPVDRTLAQDKTAGLWNHDVSSGAAAVSAMLRSKTKAGA